MRDLTTETFDAVLLDNDGTLTDSRAAVERSWVAWALDHGVDPAVLVAFHGVPTMFIAMLEHENFPKTDFSHMRTGIMAGSPCPVNVMEDVVEKITRRLVKKLGDCCVVM